MRGLFEIGQPSFFYFHFVQNYFFLLKHFSITH